MSGRADGDRELRSNVSGSRTEPTVQQLRIFLALADELHFGRAAARLFMTQPALSRQIRVLEHFVGAPLVKRTTRRVELTETGSALLPAAEAVVRAMERFGLAVGREIRQLSGRLVVGSIGAEASMPHVRETLGELRLRHPHLTVEIRNLHFADQAEDLRNGVVDVAFLRLPVPAGIEVLRLATEPRVAVLPSWHELASQPHVSLSDLAGYPVLHLPDGAPRLWRDYWSVDPRPDGSPVLYGPVVSNMEALLHAVSSGEGMSFLPRAAQDLFARQGISFLDVPELEPSTSVLAWVPSAASRPAVAAIREVAGRSAVD
ncbi:LysR family transcriptional regulator [Streptomyces sp. NPDC087844]|uniref:LysR family transcriptional regulator n=1 Tax=Streptomyces sp. NPDC087844 TaxID=3365805 RepID=UPI003824312D